MIIAIQRRVDSYVRYQQKPEGLGDKKASKKHPFF